MCVCVLLKKGECKNNTTAPDFIIFFLYVVESCQNHDGIVNFQEKPRLIQFS